MEGVPVLVLTRKASEEIIIDGRIKVTIVKVQGNKVRLAIDAPDEIPVHRREVAELIQREREMCDCASRDMD